MKLARPALAVALVAAVATSGVATAAVKKPAPKPVCNLITDDAGDASLQPPVPSDDSLDIVGGDLASDGKNVTAVIRVKDLAATSPGAVTGRNYYFLFELPTAENPVYFSYEEDATGGVGKFGALVPDDSTGVGTYTSSGDAVATVVADKNEIHLTVPVSALAALGKMGKGVKASNLSISTTLVRGVLVATIEDATGKSYVAGSKSCVTPGQ